MCVLIINIANVRPMVEWRKTFCVSAVIYNLYLYIERIHRKLSTDELYHGIYGNIMYNAKIKISFLRVRIEIHL